MQRQGAKSGFSLDGDSYRDCQKQAKARMARERCEDTQPSSIAEDWVVETVGLGSNLRPDY